MCEKEISSFVIHTHLVYLNTLIFMYDISNCVKSVYVQQIVVFYVTNFWGTNFLKGDISIATDFFKTYFHLGKQMMMKYQVALMYQSGTGGLGPIWVN